MSRSFETTITFNSPRVQLGSGAPPRADRIVSHERGTRCQEDNHESVEFTFAADPEGRRFGFAERTTRNGIIEENFRIPDELVVADGRPGLRAIIF